MTTYDLANGAAVLLAIFAMASLPKSQRGPAVGLALLFALNWLHYVLSWLPSPPASFFWNHGLMVRSDDIWALHFFALLAKDADNYASAPRGAWMWSELFAYKEGPDGKYDIDDEPAITERIPDDTSLLGINHEHFGGCYTWGLSMGLFRRAAEVLRLTGDVDQYSPEQQKRFRDWLWKGGDVPSLVSPSPNPHGDKE